MTQQAFYPPQQPGYPAAPPVQQAPPAQYPSYPPQQGYAAPAQPQYPSYPPQQGYAAPTQAPAPAPVLAAGSLDAYYSQPSTGGGAGLKFTGPNNQPLIGQSYVFQVARPITNADIQQQTNNQNIPQTFKDGRPKFVMIVPVQLLEPSPNHPDGLAKWYVKGAARDELVRAMAEAKAPEGAPEYGAVIRVTLTGTRQSGPGMNPAHVFAVQYVRPEGADYDAVAPSPAPAPLPAQTAAPVQQPVQQVAPQPPVQYAPPVEQQFQPPAQAPQFQPPVQQQAAPQLPAGMTPDQQALFARITGGQPAVAGQ